MMVCDKMRFGDDTFVKKWFRRERSLKENGKLSTILKRRGVRLCPSVGLYRVKIVLNVS